VAQTKRKRRRKHRGTPAGTIQHRARTGQARTREEAKQIARQRRMERLDRPPSWKSSAQRAAIAAALFGVLIVVAFGRPVAQGVSLAAFMLFVYIPLGYGMDKAIYSWRQRRKQQASTK
jgi:hypothetical protein